MCTAHNPRTRGRKANLIPSILRAFGPRPTASPWETEDSIREELFGIERLEQHAESLAAAQQITARPSPRRSLAVRLMDNEAVLIEAYRAIGSAAGERHTVTPAAEWLLDNYHLVEEQIREIRDDLPSGYYRQLPKLADGPFAGYPRVFGIAWAFVAHTDSRFDPDMLCRFVRAYQRVQPLTIGELWAVAITLRIVLEQHQRQGATNVTTRNIITSMRLVSDVDWTELVERVCLIDDLLQSGSDFASMDFPTRNLYRSAIEGLARGSKLTELEIARAALTAAADPKHQACRGDDGVDSRERDPGYHLIAGGRPTFERAVGFRAPLRSRLVRCSTRIGIGGYIVGVIIVAAIILLLSLIVLGEPRIGRWSLGLLALLGLIPSMDLAVAIVNRVVTSGFGTTILPGLELRDGVTLNLRTMVAVPTLLTTQAALEEQIERLEIHYLANPEGDLHFVLLSDWTDASTEHAEGDDALLDAAAE